MSIPLRMIRAGMPIDVLRPRSMSSCSYSSAMCFCLLVQSVSCGSTQCCGHMCSVSVCLSLLHCVSGSMLHMASINGNTNAMEALLDEGADKNIVDRWGYTPLHWAIVSGNQQAIDLLTRQRAVLSVKDPAGELCESASRNDVAQVGCDKL